MGRVRRAGLVHERGQQPSELVASVPGRHDDGRLRCVFGPHGRRSLASRGVAAGLLLDCRPVGRVGKHYGGQLGTKYFAWQGQGGELSAQIERTKFERWTSSDTAVVDFGCGAGHLLELLPARRRLGVEPNESARLVAQERGLNVVASTSEVPEQSADVVISNHALEHTLAP